MQFAELNLRYTSPEKTTALVKRAIRMGYDAVVINVDIGNFGEVVKDPAEQIQPPKKKKKRSGIQEIAEFVVDVGDVIPDPFLCDESHLDLSSLQQAGKKFRQFSRLTVTLTDSTSVHKLQHHAKLKLYDVVAVRLEDEQILMTLQRKGDFVDIVSVDADSGKIPWIYKTKIVQACVATGIGFELTYSKALFSSDCRRQFFTNARSLIDVTKGRGIVLSSGAEEIVQIRAPYDVANMSALFSAHPKNGRNFVSGNPKRILLRAQSRRTVKGALHCTGVLERIPLPSMEDQQPTNGLNRSKEAVLNLLTQIPEFQAQLNGKTGI